MLLPDGTLIPERPVRLDVDEFVADMWFKGIRFGIDVKAVAAAIQSVKPARITVAQDLAPTPGQDALVVEVSQDIHRSDAPRARSDGRVDLLSFQNRFPQIQQNMRLLKKEPPLAGLPGYDLAGRITPPTAPKDLELRFWAGDGTAVEVQAGGEFLVSTRVGFLNVDAKSSRISITDKIISTEGVSGRTTGNLELAGAYEEYGDVQELRDVTGGDITVHGHVYGNITSRGGTVLLGQNLVGGNVVNADGDITIKGVASGAIIHSRTGCIRIKRAENCVISAPRIEIEEASNCELAADDIVLALAEGCAVAGRNVAIESCGPRKRTEMLIYVLVRDVSQLDAEIVDLELRVAAFAQANAANQAEIARISELPDVRRYLALSARLRTQEVVLTPEQGQSLRKIAAAVKDDVQAITKAMQDLKAGSAQHQVLRERADRVIAQKAEAAGYARCGLHLVDGETLVRTLPYQGCSEPLYLLPAKELKQRLRGTPVSGEILLAASHGSLDWHLAGHRSP
ncbi:MAG: flagellar assembly protein A [Sphingomonadaceae bacterium]